MMEWLKYLFAKKHPDYSWLEVILCRIEGHPNGPIWYDNWGDSPDMHCKNCGDDLG